MPDLLSDDALSLRHLDSAVGLTERFNLPQSFFGNLETDNDWSFVIKVHALVEMALNMLITGAIGQKLNDIVARLDTGDRRYGKLAFVKELELLPSEARKFVRQLGELRNELAHDVRKVDFSLANWIAHLPKAELDNFLNSLNFDFEGQPTSNEKLKNKNAARKFPAKLVRLLIVGTSLKIVWRAIDMDFNRFVAPHYKEIERLQGLVASYEAGKKSISKDS